MQVENKLIAESISYTSSKANMKVRTEEVGDLMDIDAYCANLDECIIIDNDIWEQEVEDGIKFMDWLYSGSGEGSEDDRARIRSFINRNYIERNSTLDNVEEIQVALGEYEDAVSNERQYIEKRRDILASITSVEDYQKFMESCFCNSCFADNILSGMKYIDSFASHTREITDCLALLNDEAVDLYEKYRNNLKEAIAILTAKQIECSLDHSHKDALIFPFTYYEEIEGVKQPIQKEITCEPHLKLINRYSNLRIYFFWMDEMVGEGKKVLVGRIGGHPY